MVPKGTWGREIEGQRSQERSQLREAAQVRNEATLDPGLDAKLGQFWIDEMADQERR